MNSARWLQVKLVGWRRQPGCSAAMSARNPRRLSIDETLQLARKFLGVTYTWGGVSSRGFDCSGFTQMLERQRGIVMPRDADLQAAWSGVVPVERKDLQPGDLLFFGGERELRSRTRECTLATANSFTTQRTTTRACKLANWTISPGPPFWSEHGEYKQSNRREMLKIAGAATVGMHFTAPLRV